LVAARSEQVAALFDGRLGFGTAGLRGAMGPGPNRMNRLVVRQTTAGLMKWLQPAPTVVIGYDARHNSDAFARDVAGVVASAGGRAELMDRPQPTPVLAHAVVDRGADAGVMITASHNPSADNGYKLYLADGVQLIDPAATEIADQIELAAAAWPGDAEAGEWDRPGGLAAASDRIIRLGDEVAARHREAAVGATLTGHRSVKVVYTPMHGVGGAQVLAAFEAAGFPPPTVVAEQFAPDPDFPTVAAPNPEESGALDLAIAEAGAAGADVVLANDPDADRLAVALPDRAGRWRRLTGDQVGILLADHVIGHTSGADRLVASSIVSSRMISALAGAEGVEDVRTLTGFKWIARPIVDRPDRRYLLGYEEALGYCVGDRVRDKDGISAALVMAELVAETLAGGQTLWDRLDALAQRLGVHLTGPVTIRFDGGSSGAGAAAAGLARREEVMARAAASPPTELAGIPVTAVENLAEGRRLPKATGVVWDLADRSRVIVRPSGTEPKLKAYVEVIEPTETCPVAEATVRAAARLDRMRAAVARLLEA
jgi:phosphomannomutase